MTMIGEKGVTQGRRHGGGIGGNAPPGRNPRPRAMPPLVEILAPGQCNIIGYLPTYLSHIPVRGSNFPLYIGQNPWKPPNFFLARYARSSRKTMYPCTKRN